MRLRQCLIVSACLNLLLVAVVIRAACVGTKCEGFQRVSRHETVGVASVRHLTNAAVPALAEVAARFDWREVESDDYHVYVANLRAIGCPEETIRDIIMADVDELFAGRIKELVDGVTGRFWECMLNKEELGKLVEDKVKELGDLKDERVDLLGELLGDNNPEARMREAEQQKEERAKWTQTLDFLPEDKLARFLEIKDRFQAARQGLGQSANIVAPEERERKMRELALEEDRQIRALFTAQELDEYRLRTSSAADLRNDLADFQATESELRALARVKMDQQEKATAKPEANARIKELLGADRFAEYERAADEAYRQILKITDRFELPSETTAQVYQMRKEAEVLAGKIRDDANRTVEERQAILLAMQAEAEKSISAALGPKAFAAYRKYGDGWLSRMAEGVR